MKFFVLWGATEIGREMSRFPDLSLLENVKNFALSALAASLPLANSTSMDPSLSLSQRNTLPNRSQPSFRWKGVSVDSLVWSHEKTSTRGLEGMGRPLGSEVSIGWESVGFVAWSLAKANVEGLTVTGGLAKVGGSADVGFPTVGGLVAEAKGSAEAGGWPSAEALGLELAEAACVAEADWVAEAEVVTEVTKEDSMVAALVSTSPPADAPQRRHYMA